MVKQKYENCEKKVTIFILFDSLIARIFTVFGHSLLGDRVLHKEAWVAKLLGTHLSVQVHKKVKFNNLPLELKGLKRLPAQISFIVTHSILIGHSCSKRKI